MKYILLIFLFFYYPFSHAAECTLYEQTHPTFILNGAHLSTGKCKTCGTCHINGIFRGTPKSCLTCHNGDPARQTVARSARHIPTLLVECSNCHGTASFTTGTRMNHTSVSTSRCDSCHNGSYTTYGADGKPRGHVATTQDCRSCHKRTNSWDA